MFHWSSILIHGLLPIMSLILSFPIHSHQKTQIQRMIVFYCELCLYVKSLCYFGFLCFWQGQDGLNTEFHWFYWNEVWGVRGWGVLMLFTFFSHPLTQMEANLYYINSQKMRIQDWFVIFGQFHVVIFVIKSFRKFLQINSTMFCWIWLAMNKVILF